MSMPPIIIDTNIIFSALLSVRSQFTEFIFKSEYDLFVCELVLVELFKRKEKIIQRSQLTEDELIKVYHILLRRINLYKEDLISIENRSLAYEFCRDVDETDTPHVALTLQLQGLLWTGDKKLKAGLKQKGFEYFFEPDL